MKHPTSGEMLGDCSLFPCFRGRKSKTVDGNSYLDPFLLVSGIGGSILHSKDERFGFQTRVWVQIFLANLEFKKKLWSIYNPKKGYTKSVDDNTEIVVPEDDYGLYAIDILDPSLTSIIYKKGTTLFGYGYDFRQSNRIEKILDGLKVKLAAAYKASGGRKVNIISHSMGELLMLCFLSLYPDFCAMRGMTCDLNCPSTGICTVCKQVDLHRVPVSRQFLYTLSCCSIAISIGRVIHLVECPSIYEMLPNPQFKWKKQPQIRVWQKESEGKETSSVKLESYGPTESVVLFEEALRNNEIEPMGLSPLNYGKSTFTDRWYVGVRWAAGTRQILNNAQLPNGVSFYNIFGTSFDTPIDVCYVSETSPIEDLSEICNSMVSKLIFVFEILYASYHIVPQYSYVDGDETLPAESTKADGFAAAERVGVGATHRGLLHDKQVFQLIQKWLGAAQTSNQHSKNFRVKSMISGFAKFGLPDNAEKIFEQMGERNVVSLNGLMVRLVRQKQGETATEFAVLEERRKGREVHAFVLRTCLNYVKVAIGNGLINMYAKCGA
ncbi:hypothetical protein HHK36_009210 [Tetracentron sinense]|uniref:Uncharacterized protein n=1 Tax=Tetracentron sinense TaxID=13715 RepID=A0A835DKU0_TETSI|nr:hypothetical protein HHK36_009210 [Tetracentron sinense]